MDCQIESLNFIFGYLYLPFFIQESQFLSLNCFGVTLILKRFIISIFDAEELDIVAMIETLLLDNLMFHLMSMFLFTAVLCSQLFGC